MSKLLNWDKVPPVGEVVEVYVDNADYWAKVKVLAVDGGNVVWRNGSDGLSYIGTPLEYVRPLRTERDVLIDEAEELCGGIIDMPAVVRELIDAGWRPIKQQSEDDFANYAMKNRMGILSTHTWLDLYRAGCRFVEQGE